MSDYYIHMQDNTGYLYLDCQEDGCYTRWSISYVNLEPGSNARRTVVEVQQNELPHEVLKAVSAISGTIAGYYRLL